MTQCISTAGPSVGQCPRYGCHYCIIISVISNDCKRTQMQWLHQRKQNQKLKTNPKLTKLNFAGVFLTPHRGVLLPGPTLSPEKVNLTLDIRQDRMYFDVLLPTTRQYIITTPKLYL
jgi:hypothetical protein